MNFGALEWTVIEGIVMMVELNPTELKNKKLPNLFSDRLALFSELVVRKLSAPTLITQHKQLIIDLEHHAKVRNSFLHGPWIDVPGTDIDSTKNKLANRPISLGELRGAAFAQRSVTPREVEEAANSTVTLNRRLNDHLGVVAAAIQPAIYSTHANPRVVRFHGNEANSEIVTRRLTSTPPSPQKPAAEGR